MNQLYFSRRGMLALPIGAAASTAVAQLPALAQLPTKTNDEGEAVRIATDAYIFGYPLITTYLTRRVMTNVARPEGIRAPINQFANVREYPSAAFTGITAPNADTLYSEGWLDLGPEPIVVSWPDMGDRYYLFPMLDAWTNVIAAPGTRTTAVGRRPMSSPAPAIAVPCPPASRASVRRPTSSGCMGAHIAPARPTITKRFTHCKTSIGLCL